MNVLCVIPARGGSKGIPRKNLRPMAGKPLIYYSITACLRVPEITRVVVSTDDDEIALFARRFGAQVSMRPAELAADATTLDPVISHCLATCEEESGDSFDAVVTVQPTSPLISHAEIGEVLRKLKAEELDTVITVVDDRHLCWTEQEGRYVPEYSARVNRQFLPPRFRETGAVVACRSDLLRTTGSRIGSAVGLVEVEQEKSFDIDTFSDFMLCQNLLLRKRVLFCVVGNQSVGMGHVYRTLMLAHELVEHKLQFLCTEEHQLAADFIAGRNFPVSVCPADRLIQQIDSLSPHLVINDILDTEASYILQLKQRGLSVVNFEDLGSGMAHADLVVNALYPPAQYSPNVRSGPDYFCLRDEFIHRGNPGTESGTDYVLLCFGGVDEGNLSQRVLEIIYPECRSLGLGITIVLGHGYLHAASLRQAAERLGAADIELVWTTPTISEYMLRARFAITSGGRTVFELASLCKPTLVICQNDRETTHSFGANQPGIVNLGHRQRVTDTEIRTAFMNLATTPGQLDGMARSLASTDFSKGKSRVISLIKEVMENIDA